MTRRLVPRLACLLVLGAALLRAGGAAVAQDAGAADASSPPDRVAARAVWSAPQAHPGDQRALAVVLDIRPGWHINPDAAQAPSVGDFQPYPASLKITAPPRPGVVAGRWQFPKPHAVKVAFAQGEIMTWSGRTVLYVPVVVEAKAAPGRYVVKIEFEYQACDDRTCEMPRTAVLEPALEVVPPGSPPGSPGAATATAPAENAALFAGFDSSAFAGMGAGLIGRGGGAAPRQTVPLGLFGWHTTLDPSTAIGLALLLFFAALGGLLLNLTPCVLPVIPIKILGLSQAAGNRGRCFVLGLAMAAGVMLFWGGLGLAVASIAGFTATNQLFQYPAFTIGVGVVIAAMAVGMCGLFSLRLPQFVYAISPRHDTVAGSLGFGIMTAVLSTPCTAPFMGGAAAWAVTQPPVVTLTTFAAIGAGMALPYLLLSAFPQLLAWMPRAGPGSELIKQVMGLLMLAAAAYFIGVGLSGWRVTPPEPPGRGYWWAVAGLVAAAGGWLAWRAVTLPARAKPQARPKNWWARGAFAALGAAMVAVALTGAAQFTDRGPIPWTYYTPQRFAEAQAAKQVVVLDFTAEWCLNCKTLEQTVLHDPRVVAALNQRDVLPMKVDLTGHNAAGNQKLHAVGRLTIPLLVIVAPDGREALKSDFYTAEEVVRAVGAAQEARRAGS